MTHITGSGAFKDVARAVMVFARDGDGGERVFTEPKNSVGRDDLPSLTYEIRQAVIDTPTGPAPTGVFVFTGSTGRTVDDMLADARRGREPSSPVTMFLVDYITKHADKDSGEVNAADVIAAAVAQGFTENQICHARSRSRDPKISTRREGLAGKGRQLWKLKRD